MKSDSVVVHTDFYDLVRKQQSMTTDKVCLSDENCVLKYMLYHVAGKIIINWNISVGFLTSRNGGEEGLSLATKSVVIRVERASNSESITMSVTLGGTVLYLCGLTTVTWWPRLPSSSPTSINPILWLLAGAAYYLNREKNTFSTYLEPNGIQTR